MDTGSGVGIIESTIFLFECVQVWPLFLIFLDFQVR